MDEVETHYLKDAVALDKGQLEHLIALYWDDIWNYVYLMIRDRGASDDLAQETFIRAFRSLASFRGESSYRTWLVRIARNLTLNYKRSTLFRKMVPLGDSLIGRQSESAETEAVKRESISEIWELVLRLPVKQREVLLLDARYGMSMGEIAKLLGVPEGTVKSRLNRARSRMNEWLKGEMRDE